MSSRSRPHPGSCAVGRGFCPGPFREFFHIQKLLNEKKSKKVNVVGLWSRCPPLTCREV